MPLVLDPASSLLEAQNQRDELAKALYSVLVGIGVLNTDGVATGPHLLMAAEDVAREHGVDESVTAAYGSPGA